MSEQEGVIKYQLNHNNAPLARHISLSKINAWRQIFLKLGLIGQQPDRYAGYGFGNISQRLPANHTSDLQFLISGTQTGHIKTLTQSHYCRILKAQPDKNRLASSGETKPSSEALTHASVYQHNKNIQAVIHIHSPEIWHNTQMLNLPHTNANIAYGTPEMAIEVNRLLQSLNNPDSGIFSMSGHEDGIIAFSESMEKAATTLIHYYAKAIAL